MQSIFFQFLWLVFLRIQHLWLDFYHQVLKFLSFRYPPSVTVWFWFRILSLFYAQLLGIIPFLFFWCGISVLEVCIDISSSDHGFLFFFPGSSLSIDEPNLGILFSSPERTAILKLSLLCLHCSSDINYCTYFALQSLMY